MTAFARPSRRASSPNSFLPQPGGGRALRSVVVGSRSVCELCEWRTVPSPARDHASYPQFWHPKGGPPAGMPDFGDFPLSQPGA